MKNLFRFISILIITLVITTLTACNTRDYPDNYRVIRSPQGQEMVVVQDDDGNQFLMEYLMFQNLMNNGGYGSVLSQYRQNTGLYPRYNTNTYSNWNNVRNVPRSQFNYYRTPTYSNTQYSSPEPTNIITRESNRNKTYTPSYTAPKTSTFRSNTTYSTPKNTSTFRTNTYSKPSTSTFRSNSSGFSSKPSTTSSFRSSSSSSSKKSKSTF